MWRNCPTSVRALMLGTIALLALCACGKNDSTPPSIKLLAATGGHVVFSATWTHCSDHSPNPDDGGTWIVTGTSFSAEENDYTSVGGVCNAGQTHKWSATFSMAAGADEALSGWTDETVLTTAPQRLNGQGTLDDPPSATLVTVTTLTSDGGTNAPSVGAALELFMFMDDTLPNARVYLDAGTPSPACAPHSGETTDGSCLDINNYLVKL